MHFLAIGPSEHPAATRRLRLLPALASAPALAAAPALAVAMALLLPLVAQEPPARSVVRPVEFSTSQDDNLFSLLRSQEHIHAYEEALDEIVRGEHETAVDRLHRLLQTEAGGVVPVGPGRFVGLRLAAVTALANLPAAAQTAYEELVRREAGALLADVQALSPEQLALLADKFPAAAHGRRARFRLADQALERGDGFTAVAHYRQALDGSAIGSRDEQRAATGLYLAELLREPDAARADAGQQRLTAVGDDVVTALPPADGIGRRAAFGGSSGRAPMEAPAGRLASIWSEDIVAPFFDQRAIGTFAMHPVGDLDGVFVNTGHEVVAIDPLRRGLAWVTPSPMRDESHNYSDSTNHDTILAAACDDELVVASLQIPDKTVNVDFQAGLRILWKIPQRRLFAFSRQTGKLLWSHYDDVDGSRTRRFRGHDTCGNPMLLGDTVYVPSHDRSGAIQFSVAAYEARTGQPKWRRLICSSQQDVNMFGNARTEFTASPLALAGGVLFGSSNLGVAYALEAATGRVRWISAYDVVRMPRAMLHRQEDRPVYFANNAPVVAAGVACCTPLDSQFVLGFDAEDGRTLWRLPADATVGGVDHRVLWLAGALADEFVLAGSGCVAVRARSANGNEPEVRSLVRPEQQNERRDPRLPARPAVAGDRLWLPRADRLLAFDRDGELKETVRLPQYLPGNLLFVGGILVSVRQRNCEVLADTSALLARCEEQAKARTDDPATLLRLASLRRALLPADASDGQIDAVMALYRRGLEVCVRNNLPTQHPVRAALQRELFDHAFAVARRAFTVGAGDRLELLAAARDAAPDQGAWVDVQTMLLDACNEDRKRYTAELQRLAAQAPLATMPIGDGIPVPTFVLWQRALREPEPVAAVQLWQELIEQHADAALIDGRAADVAQRAIAVQMQAHGAACYQAIATRADADLAAAGDDRSKLEALAQRYPNSAAATAARLRLLDAAVRNGDLAVAGAVFAETTVRGTAVPGVLRRLMVAAEQRGNHALANAVASRLAAYGNEHSDWPDDRGATYSAVLQARSAPPATTAVRPTLPSDDLAFVPTRDFLLPIRTQLAPGFAPLTSGAVPLYVGTGNELRALDPTSKGSDKAPLFALAYEYLDHLILCGDALVVPDLGRVHAVDARSGAVRWELPNPRSRTFESLGLVDGVLQLLVQPRSGGGGNELWGVEPLSGAVLFRRPLAPEQLHPKVAGDSLLRMQFATDGAVQVERLEPLTGLPRGAWSLPAGALQNLLQMSPDSIAARQYPIGLCADERTLYLPVEPPGEGAPSVVAVDGAAEPRWRWQGRARTTLGMLVNAGDHLVVVELSERESSRMLLLRCRDGSPAREVDLGADATVLNWERAWLATPAPAVVAVESFVDSARRQRQLVCYGTAADGATFAVPLASEDGEVMLAPQFGPDFLAFATRPRRGAGSVRLYALRLADRTGLFPDSRKFRRIDLSGNRDGMAAFGPYTVLTGTQGLLLVGSAAALPAKPKPTTEGK